MYLWVERRANCDDALRKVPEVVSSWCIVKSGSEEEIALSCLSTPTAMRLAYKEDPWLLSFGTYMKICIVSISVAISWLRRGGVMNACSPFTLVIAHLGHSQFTVLRPQRLLEELHMIFGNNFIMNTAPLPVLLLCPVVLIIS